MADTKLTPVKDLYLDLSNYRMRPQLDEASAVRTMASVSPKRFWALMESLLADGYLPTENILVLRLDSDGRLEVKEGNRRVGLLKVLLGLLPLDTLAIPERQKERIGGLSDAWKRSNATVPCAIYPQREAKIVDRIVTLAHGKGDYAGRDPWSALARARHRHYALKRSEPAVVLLDEYLAVGTNLNAAERAEWSGEYPITVLPELMQNVARRLGLRYSSDLARRYPEIDYRMAIDSLLRDVGLKHIGFPQIRNSFEDLAAKYGLPSEDASDRKKRARTPHTSTTTAEDFEGTEPSSASDSDEASSPSKSVDLEPKGAGSGFTEGTVSDGVATASTPSARTTRKSSASSIADPLTVRRVLKQWKPRGKNREKIVTLKEELVALDLNKNPLAFCFLLRSIFELSAKAYCDDNKGVAGAPRYIEKDGHVPKLKGVLEAIVKFMTDGTADRNEEKLLFGARAELTKEFSILSVDSMNQLVHNPAFSVTTSEVATRFMNVFPLLEALN